MQARLEAHSLLLTHSGRQLGGDPVNSGRQEHDGDSPVTLHCELGPHGDGWHGFDGTGVGTSSANILYISNVKAKFTLCSYVSKDIE